ncbi:hypothetical protein FRC08_012667 [Ceratobasidium sp. 394]|nr:hypothetical protein FRC08_012667 [Ceratobasidium sp. 394]
MPGAKTQAKAKAKPGATALIKDRSTNEETRDNAPKRKSPAIRMIDNGKTVEIEYPDSRIEQWPMIHKPKQVEKALGREMHCGDGPGFDRTHEFYLDLRNQLRLCTRATLGLGYNHNWASVSIENKHEIISATKHELPVSLSIH